MLKDDTNYKELNNRQILLKLIFDMRYYLHICNQKDDDYIRIGSATRVLEEYAKFPYRIYQIIEDYKKGRIKLDIIEDLSCDLYNRIGRLYGMYRNATDELRSLENRILYLELSCPNLKSFAIELMDFASRLPDDSCSKKEVYYHITELLKLLPYDTSIDEREYLSTKCCDFKWYQAFYFENSTVDRHRVKIDFYALMLSLLDSENPARPQLIERATVAYLKKNPSWQLDSDILKMLLAQDREKSKNIPPNFLKLLKVYGKTPKSKTEMMLKEIMAERRERFGTVDIDYMSSLFDKFINILPSDECLSLFIKTLLLEPNGLELIDSLDVYISSIYGENLYKQFLEIYKTICPPKNPKHFFLAIKRSTSG